MLTFLPRPILVFFLKAFVVFLLWKALYLIVLRPAEFPDRQLTSMIGHGTTMLLNIADRKGPVYSAREGSNTKMVEGKVVDEFMMDIYHGEERTLRIANVCNGLELMVMYVGFLLCYPASSGRKWKFALPGILLICLMNILRCALLVLIYIYSRTILDFSHHFLFTFLIYAVIFLLWFRFAKKSFIHAT